MMHIAYCTIHVTKNTSCMHFRWSRRHNRSWVQCYRIHNNIDGLLQASWFKHDAMDPLSPRFVWLHKPTRVQIFTIQTVQSVTHWASRSRAVALSFCKVFGSRHFIFPGWCSLANCSQKRKWKANIASLSHISMLSTNYNPQPSPALSPPLHPLFHRAPGPAVACRLRRRGYAAAVPPTYRAKPLFPCSSVLSLRLSQSITWQLMFQHMFLSFLRFIVFHTGLRRPNHFMLTVMKLPHIEQVHENNI